MKPILILGMHGLGDNVYQLAHVRQESERREVYLSTPWPEIYEDLPIKFVRPPRQYRTQTKNTDRNEGRWETRMPRQRDVKGFWYGLKGPGDNAVREFERIFGVLDPFRFDLPDMGPSPIRTQKKLAVIRPVTVRTEWRNKARNPEPKYVETAVRLLNARGWHTVSVADLEPGREWLMGEPLDTHKTYNGGEFTVRPLLSLIRHADLVVGGVGWIVPASIATRTPLIVIGGGMGWHNAPEKVTDPRMDLSRVRFILPRPYCRCGNSRHDCTKGIPDFEAEFVRAVDRVASHRLAA